MSARFEGIKIALLQALTRYGLRPWLSPRWPIALQRQALSLCGKMLRQPGHVLRSEQMLAGRPSLALLPAQHVAGRSLLYLHGGAYITGGFGSHHKLCAWLAQTSQVRTWLFDYRLAPEHPCPAAVEDALAAYRALLAQGQEPAHMLLGGDSAGGGLALSTAVAIRDADLPPPAALILLSPWVDLSLSGPSQKTHARRDAMLSEHWVRQGARAYAGDRPLNDPVCSPLYAELSGLPPVLIQVGSEEILLDDARRLYRQLRQAGVDAALEEYAGGGHVFQVHGGQLKLADRALAAIAEFVTRNLPAGQ